MRQLLIKTCPTCGSKRIRRVKRSVESRRGGEPFTARGIEVEECPDCGERRFGPDALGGDGGAAAEAEEEVAAEEVGLIRG
jgi:YgiT-type zinc finger domain-containing protein